MKIYGRADVHGVIDKADVVLFREFRLERAAKLEDFEQYVKLRNREIINTTILGGASNLKSTLNRSTLAGTVSVRGV